MTRGPICVLVLASAAACQDPTQVTLEITTDLSCDVFDGTSITAGLLGEIEDKPAGAVTTTCDDAGHVGTLVVVPSDADDAELAVKVIAASGQGVEQCVAPDYAAVEPGAAGCIVARRALRF